jgi:DUF1680 family protein
VPRPWRQGDVLELHLPLTPRRISSPPEVAGNAGRVALARGPLIFCVEGVDNPTADLASAPVSRSGQIEARQVDDPVLGRIVALQAGALTAIPYYAWANRAPGPMHVWTREGEPVIA